jgi:N utilization substance protein B
MGFRRKARECALQMLYQHDFTRDDPRSIEATYFAEAGKVPPAARSYAEQLLEGVIGRLEEIDELISARSEHWRLSRMARVDRNILRLAVYEFLAESQTPRKVVINEACEIARKFGSEDSVGFVNGILDAIMRELERAPRSA